MIIKDKVLGKCECEISFEASYEDSYLMSGYSETLDRELTEEELERLQNEVDLYEEYMEHSISRAEYYYEGER